MLKEENDRMSSSFVRQTSLSTFAVCHLHTRNPVCSVSLFFRDKKKNYIIPRRPYRPGSVILVATTSHRWLCSLFFFLKKNATGVECYAPSLSLRCWFVVKEKIFMAVSQSSQIYDGFYAMTISCNLFHPRKSRCITFTKFLHFILKASR